MKDQREEWELLCRQAAQEQDHERLLHLVRRIDELLAAKEMVLQETRVPASERGNCVFQIAYDEKLLVTREQMLKARGYYVVSVFGNENAKRLLARNLGYQVRLFIVGHNAPLGTRKEMVHWIRENFPSAKILVLNSPQDKIAGADWNFVLNGEDPEEWLGVIGSA